MQKITDTHVNAAMRLFHGQPGQPTTDELLRRVLEQYEAGRVAAAPNGRDVVAEAQRAIVESVTAQPADAWRKLFGQVAKALNCLPSAFVGENEHVLRKAAQLDVPPTPAAQSSTANEVQWRNIKKAVKAVADACFGSPEDAKYGHCHVAVTTILTAKDGIRVDLEPLPITPQPHVEDTARLEFVMHNLSGKALRDINVIPASGGLEFYRAAIDAAMASKKETL